jgi:hypothetical protein
VSSSVLDRYLRVICCQGQCLPWLPRSEIIGVNLRFADLGASAGIRFCIKAVRSGTISEVLRNFMNKNQDKQTQILAASLLLNFLAVVVAIQNKTLRKPDESHRSSLDTVCLVALSRCWGSITQIDCTFSSSASFSLALQCPAHSFVPHSRPPALA